MCNWFQFSSYHYGIKFNDYKHVVEIEMIQLASMGGENAN